MAARRFIVFLLPLLLYGAPSNQWNVVLVSIDTLRTDRLGCYGRRPTVSPTIDALALEGVQFDHAYTPAPLTLPAHTSLLTGLYPNRHGIHDNGERLGASAETLAEAFRGSSYETAAFIGSFILDRRFGLSRGFDEYVGSFDLHRHAGDDPGAVQIRGDQVEKAAEEWIKRPHNRPFFVFLHFYDLHGPFLLPSPWRERYSRNLYDGELAYVDHLLSRFRAAIRAAGIGAKTILVVTADHGEGLGEHGESNHGFFVYNSTIRVPLIIRFPDGRGAGRRVASVVRLIDVGPTVLAVCGLSAFKAADGVSLLDAIERDAKLDLSAYSESVYPLRHFHCAPPMAWTTTDYSFIQAPRVELYAHRTDSAETHNITAQHPDVVREFRDKLRPFALAVSSAGASKASPDTLTKLKSLGYLGGSSVVASNLADAKDRIKLFGQYQAALAEEAAGRADRAIAQLEQVLAVDPDIIGARIELGLARQRMHQDQEAVKDFQTALRVDPRNALVHYNLGVSLSNLHDDDNALREFDLAAALEPSTSRALVGRGLAQARKGMIREAIASLTAALEIDRNDFDALYNRGSLLGMLRQWDGSWRDLNRAAEVEPGDARVHVALGTLHAHTGDNNGALREYERATALDPRSSVAHSGLGLVYRKLGQDAKGSAELSKALELDPRNADARVALGK
jgi:arylsulfatase A-like enzyme/tetratricopeptide (TPR) repeat protein